MEKVEVDISQLEIVDSVVEDKITNTCILNNTTVEPECMRRSTRKKIRPLDSEKRRVQSKPKRLPDDPNSKTVINYYLDKKIKRNPTHLETIFEDSSTMSRRKYSRSLQFPVEISLAKNKNKVKKRSMKAKQRGNFKPKKLSMDLLLKKLGNLDDIGDDC